VLAPHLLGYEVTNALHRRALSGAISPGDTARGVGDVLSTVNLRSARSMHARALELARRLNRPATYDAHYLTLAEQEGCECWTADERLWNAVRETLPYVRWIGEYHAGME
jgi:predicted nucleic acid-binding protein